MSELSPNSSATSDFLAAYQKATVQEILLRLQGKSSQLLSYNEVAEKLKLQARSDRGVQMIPLEAIVGSVGRYTDFTRTFLPRNYNDKERWVRVKALFDDPHGSGYPPIDVYKVSDVYFVLDGNHRVSIARQEGWQSIQANVIEIKTSIHLTPDTQPDELIIKAEYADFLTETSIANQRPNVDLSVTIPGQYEKLTQQIHIHRYYAWTDKQHSLSFDEAVLDWYDAIYIPLAETIRDRGLMRGFPNRTITDFYLWVTEHRDTLQKELGWAIRSQAVADVLAQQSGHAPSSLETGTWRKSKLMERYTEKLFKDILVPLSGEDKSWYALEQALKVAQREGAVLQGLHVAENEQLLNTPKVLALQEQFGKSCQAVDVRGMLALEVGDPTRKILERSRLADLVVIKISYPPSAGISGLASPLRTIIDRASRPILALPAGPSPMQNALLAFDGSSRAKEALFLATYLAEQWNTRLTVFTALENKKLTAIIQNEARDYLEFHEIEANYLIEPGANDSLDQVIEEHGIDLLLMGAYSGSALKEVFTGSAVNWMLRNTKIPILICK